MTSLSNVDLYPPVIVDSGSPATQLSYRVNISWTSNMDIRQQLKAIQCVANFECRVRPFKTAIVNINFLDNEQGICHEWPQYLVGSGLCDMIPPGQISTYRLLL